MLSDLDTALRDCDLSTGKLELEDSECEACLGYEGSSRLAWDTQ